MDQIKLYNLELKTFTEQNVLDYCQINNINPDDITYLDLSDNKLTDISGIKLFKNLKKLYLDYNRVTDISGIKLFKNLRLLYLNNNEITDIFVLKDLKNLEILNISNNQIKDISVIQYLKNLQILRIDYLKLESDQIEYIKLLKNLEELWCNNGFKKMNNINQLNENIEIYI